MKKAILKALTLILACVFVLGMGIMSISADDAVPGDANNDGELSIIDALLIVKAVANGTALENSDVNGDGKTNLLDVIGVIKLIATGEAPEVGEQDKTTADIVVENGTVKEAVSINGEKVSAAVPEGVTVDDGATSLTLSVSAMDSTGGNIATGENEESVSYDVHIEGVSEANTVAIVVDLGAILPKGQNTGTVALYHVENGETVKMTQVMTLAELDSHNEFYYWPATGNVYVALATFSEIMAVNDTENEWNGTADHAWYTANPDATEFVIANANQLWSLSQIVGGMATDIAQDSFDGKTVKLAADINIGDLDSENGKVFYPIGYYNSTNSYDKVTGGSVTSSVYSFEGTFDGTGHTIKNFYQNTWEMFGDYNNGYSGTPNHYKDGMGLFGYVYNGTVKNLTVENFSSDGEFTPTGVIAAYACNAAFKNIAIVNCNPRVYNTGNGGIVGIGGNDSDPDTYKLTFENITIDNTNKITALWGSWDVACGGLVGMFRGAGHVYMTNCHVAAQIDVFNDVCGNYQYYWYRYAGMLIGTNKTMVEKDGYTVPETSKYHAENCTVHFGEWNNYYYCELVANSLASYTHDHQFSRLDKADSVDVENRTVTIDGVTANIPNGRVNYYTVNDENAPASDENVTCYHFVDGKVWEHSDAGEEVVNGETVLREDRQHYYLPFNQLFTGYGWGVKHIPVGEFAGVTILDREVAESVEKFTGIANNCVYTTDVPVKIGDLFKAIEETDVAIDTDNVQVFVSPVDETSTASGTYNVNTADWTQGTITFSGIGAATVTITDYFYCTPITINVYVHGCDNSYVKYVENNGKYDLKCIGCEKVFATEQEDVVYLDPENKLYTSNDNALGITPECALVSVNMAVERLKETGGTIKLLSNFFVDKDGFNFPHGSDHMINSYWDKEITFTSHYFNEENEAECGFIIGHHGAAVNFDGPVKFEYILIDGRYVDSECKTEKGTPNTSDNGYYSIPVFTFNWNDFTAGDGIVAYGASYFVIGNHFNTGGGTIEFYEGETEYLVYDEDVGGITDLGGKTVKVEFNRSIAKPVRVNSDINEDGTINENDVQPAVTYLDVWLGTRNRFNVKTSEGTCYVRNANVEFTSFGATFGDVYVGSVGVDVRPYVTTKVSGCSVTAGFYNSNKNGILYEDGSSHADYIVVGGNNFVNNEATLDNFKLYLYDDFYVDRAGEDEDCILTRNVKDLEIYISSGRNFVTQKPVIGKINATRGSQYDFDLGEETHKITLCLGSHSVNNKYPIIHEDTMYFKEHATLYYVNECEYDDEGKCNVCGKSNKQLTDFVDLFGTVENEIPDELQ